MTASELASPRTAQRTPSEWKVAGSATDSSGCDAASPETAARRPPVVSSRMATFLPQAAPPKATATNTSIAQEIVRPHSGAEHLDDVKETSDSRERRRFRSEERRVGKECR